MKTFLLDNWPRPMFWLQAKILHLIWEHQVSSPIPSVHLLQEQAGGWKWPISLCSATPLPAPDSQTGSIPSLLLLSKKDHQLAQVRRDLMRSPGPISPPEKRPPRDGCPGPWWDGFWISSGMDNACVGNLDHAPPLPVVISQGNLRQAGTALLP